MSSVKTAVTAIVIQFKANTPVSETPTATAPSGLVDFTELSGVSFVRPTLDKAAVTTLNRSTKAAAATYIKVGIDFVSGSGTQFGIDPTGRTRTLGFVRQHVYYPLGFGLDFALTIVDSARAIFHRQVLSSGLLQFRDSDGPVAVDIPEDRAAGWGRFDVQTPFWMTDTV